MNTSRPESPWAQTIDTSDAGATVRIPWDNPDGTPGGFMTMPRTDASVLAAMLLDFLGEAPAAFGPFKPRRGDAVAQWLRAQREEAVDYPAAYRVTDGLLDRYRLHADMGIPLDGHACEARVVGDCECLETPVEEVDV